MAAKEIPGLEWIWIGGIGVLVSVAGIFVAPVPAIYIGTLVISALPLARGLFVFFRSRNPEGKPTVKKARPSKPHPPNLEPFDPEKGEEVLEQRRLKIICTRCLDDPDMEEDKDVGTSWPANDPRLKIDPAQFPCNYCMSVMTVSPSKVPSGGYSKAAEECSPDRSAIAFFIEGTPHGFYALSARLRRDRKRAVVVPPAPMPSLDARATKLQELHDFRASRRPSIEAQRNPEALRDFDKMIENKRIAIMSEDDE